MRWPSATVVVTLSLTVAGCGSDEPTTPTPPRVQLELLRTLQHGTDAGALAFSPDGRILATGGWTIGQEGTVKLWSTATWSEAASFTAFFQGVYSLGFLPDGVRLAGSGFDPAGEGVKLWDAPSARVLWSRDRSRPRSLAVSPDGEWLAVASSDEREIEVLSVRDGSLLRRFTAHEWQLLTLAVSADGRYLVSGAADTRVKIWSLPAFTEQAVLVGHVNPVWAVAASRDGRYVGSATIDNTVRLWRTSDGSAIASDDQGARVWSVAFSPDGTLLASGGNSGVVVYRVAETMERLASAGGAASDVQFSPDGQLLAASLEDSIQGTAGTIRIWRVSR